MNTIQTPQKYVPRLHLKSQLRLRPSVKFQMHILAPSDKRLPTHGLCKPCSQTTALFTQTIIKIIFQWCVNLFQFINLGI